MTSVRTALLAAFVAAASLSPRAARAQTAAEHEATAARNMARWEESGRAACEAKQPGCEGMDRILHDAARAHQAAHAVDKAIAARMLLVDPRYHLHATELGRKAVYEIGATYQSIARYDEAATWYERYATESPKADRAMEALQDAVILRLGLGEDDKAIADAERFNKQYGAARPAQAATIVFAIGAHHVDKEQWVEARKRLGGSMGQIDRHATLDVRIQARALLARAIAKLDGDAKAAPEYDVVRALWKDPAAVVRTIQVQTNDDLRKLAKALTALGEARYFFAEEMRRKAEAQRLPAYTGAGRREDIAAYAAQQLVPAMSARRKAIEEAEKAYREVLDIQPMPPPSWTVRAMARVAAMRARFAAEIRALPAPRSWKPSGASPWGMPWEAVRAAWIEALEAASEPEHQKARSANRMCIDWSVKFQFVDPLARRCASWLARHYPAEFPRVDEIIDRPTHRGFGIPVAIAPEPDPREPAASSDKPSP